MNSEQFKYHLKTKTLNYINRKYTEHNCRKSKKSKTIRKRK
jgi:hypothetical protein